jgi:thiol:disulfide interchange protein
MHFKWTWGAVALACAVIACGNAAAAKPTASPTADPALASAAMTQAAGSVVVGAYDPKRDPAKDVQAAVKLSQSSHKRILLEVGGDWCVWCHIMDDFHTRHPDLLTLRTQRYVLVKVNMSDENENKTFLSQYPEIPGYPHLFVLDSDGKLLHSQDTSQLEQGESYNLDKFIAFYQKWAVK